MSILNQIKNAFLLTVAFTCTNQLNLNLVTIKIHSTQPMVCPTMNLQSEIQPKDENNSPFDREKKPGGGRLADDYTQAKLT